MVLEKLNILVIEDNPGDFLLIEEYLQDELPGGEITQAKSLKEALKNLSQENNFDAILLDLSLPDASNMDQLVEDILNLAEYIPVIILTGYSNKDFSLKNLSKGVSDYLLKDELNSSNLAKSVQYSIERKKVQRQLRNSEEKYRSLFDASPLPMWVLDRDNLNFLSVNKAAIDLYGYSKEEFLKMTVRELWAPNMEKRIQGVVSSHPNEFFKIEVNHIKKNGELIYVSVKSNPVIFDGVKARVSLVNNITAKIKAEQKLIQSEKRFKALVQEGSDLISILDCNLNYTYNSPASHTMFGLTPEEVNNTNFLDYINEEDLSQVKQNLERLKTEKSIQLPSYRIKTKNNEWRWIETIITNLKDDSAIDGIVMNSRDITDFIEQETELIASLKRYNIVAKATSDLITDYDVEKDKITVSEAATKMFGYAADEISERGEWWDDKIHPEDFEEVKPLIHKMYKEGLKNLTTEYRFRCADGSYKYILDRSYLMTDEEGNPKRVIGSMQDITERKQHLIAIETHNRRLKEIAWTQSHVVRAPLAKVMGLIDLLKNYKNDLENIDEILENILISAKELDSIIRKIAIQTEREL